MGRNPNQDRPALAAWKLPPIVGAIALSIVGGFFAGGPGAGMAVGALAAASIVVMAVRNPPRPRIVPATALDSRPRTLIVLGAALDDPGAEAVAGILEELGDEEVPEVLLISPCRSRFLERWTSDLEPGRHRAQRNLVLSSSVLAKAGVGATARVGDEDIVQMTEDELGSFAATEVVLVDEGRAAEREAAELEARLSVPLRRVPACRSSSGSSRPPRSARATSSPASPVAGSARR
jgi:hypothetical protein